MMVPLIAVDFLVFPEQDRCECKNISKLQTKFFICLFILTPKYFNS